MTDRRWRLLIVDDEPYNLQLMRQILEDKYQLSFATNGIKALELAKKIQPDLILLDIMMPDMDGYEVCRQLNNDEEIKHIPVIFVTAKIDIRDEAKGLELGAIDYIAKPISPSVARARIKNHLELKLARESIEKKNQKLEEQNRELLESVRLREDVERITRHDLKTPLNTIIACPRILMEDESLSEENVEFLKMIEDAGLKMLKMINLSLDLFKMERGIYELQAVPVNVLKIIKDVMNDSREIAEQKRLSYDIIVNGNPEDNEKNFLVKGEKLLCYSMLANLAKNAFEASPEDEKITIRLNSEKSKAFIRIHNKGAVPEDIRNNFFDKYVTYGKKWGTGLGTYSARLIADTQKGRIDFETSEDKGTTVIIMLPQADNQYDSAE